METKRIVTKSLSFCVVDDKPYISLCSDDGQHFKIELDKFHCAHLNEQTAKYIGDRVRKYWRQKG